jgi:hypothetical protein
MSNLNPRVHVTVGVLSATRTTAACNFNLQVRRRLGQACIQRDRAPRSDSDLECPVDSRMNLLKFAGGVSNKIEGPGEVPVRWCS